VSMRQVRELASRFTADELERCLDAEITSGDNLCAHDGSLEEIVSTLAEAEFVRDEVEHGVPLQDAIRALARRIRAVQQGHDPTPPD
jgi:hypothetical protein